MTFRIGQRVLCVDHGGPNWCGRGSVPNNVKRGHIYTIREIGHDAGCLWVRVEEVINTPNSCGWEWAFRASRFRPLIERKSSTEAGVEILKQIARDASERKPVKVRA